MPGPGWQLGGRYTLLDQLGTGVGGTVWRGRDDQTGIECAVKVLWPELAQDDGALARLHATIAWIGQLNHPGIVAIEDVVSEDIDADDGATRVVALVTRLVPGESLRTRLDRQGTMPAGSALLLAAQLCDALDAARAVGVVHGDVKPSNILLEPGAGFTFTLRLTDFGMSALLNRAAMRSEQHALPAAEYIAPELGAGEAPTEAADVYAVGVVLYESLAGHPPLETGGQPPGLPDSVTASLASCLDENPQQRPATADLGFVLREAAAGGEAAQVEHVQGEHVEADIAFAGPPSQATSTESAASGSAPAETVLLPAPVPSRELVPRATTVVAVRNRRRARRRGNHVWVIGGAVVGGVATAAIIMFGHSSPGATPDSGAGTTITPIVVAATPTGPGSPDPTGSHSTRPTSSGSASPSLSAGSASPSTRQVASQGAAISASTSAAASSSSPSTAASSPTVTPHTGRLYNAGAAACLDTSGAYFANGVVEQIWTCDNGVGQVLTLTASGQLTVDGGAYCLDDASSSGGSGTKAKLWTCGGQPYQQWSMLSNGLIFGRNSGLCLEVGPPGNGNGTQLELSGCDSQPHQQWSWD